MRKTNGEKREAMVTRTKVSHTVFAKEISIVDGVASTKDLEPVIVTSESIDVAKAIVAVAEKYGKQGNYFVEKIETSKATYQMPAEKFYSEATLVPEKESK